MAGYRKGAMLLFFSNTGTSSSEAMPCSVLEIQEGSSQSNLLP